MVDTSTVCFEANESASHAKPGDVCLPLRGWLFLGTQAVHDMSGSVRGDPCNLDCSQPGQLPLPSVQL